MIYLGHAAAVKDELLAWENLVYAARLQGRTLERHAAEQSLAALGLGRAAQLPARSLSQGQRKRLALARLHGAEGEPHRCGFWTNHSMRWTRMQWPRYAPTLDRHFARGGMLLYTTHTDLALQPRQALELSLAGICAMMSAFLGVIRRDLLLAMRNRADVLSSVFFFIIVAALAPLGLGPEPAMLRTIGPGMLWIAALLASMLALHRLFAQDHADGTLEQMLLSPEPASLLVAGKILAHWITTGIPLIVLSPLLALQFGLPAEQVLILMASLLLGTPILSLIGAIGAALTLGVRGGGVLIALLVLPLYVPSSFSAPAQLWRQIHNHIYFYWEACWQPQWRWLRGPQPPLCALPVSEHG
jgi:heme exporter protein B